MGLCIGAENLLYLGKRRVSRGLFRQLRPYGRDPGDAPVVGWNGAFHLTLPAFGVVAYHWADCKQREEHLHVIIGPPDLPIGSLDGLRPLWVQRTGGWRGHRLTKECADFTGAVDAYDGPLNAAALAEWRKVQEKWVKLYEHLAALPVLYIGG